MGERVGRLDLELSSIWAQTLCDAPGGRLRMLLDCLFFQD
jgi:hypothetical protein